MPIKSVSSGNMVSLSTAFVILAALCWGLSGGIAGILLAEGWDALAVSFYRGDFGLLFVIVWFALQPSRQWIGKPSILVLVGDCRTWRSWQLCVLFSEYQGGQCRGCSDAYVLRPRIRLSHVFHDQAGKTRFIQMGLDVNSDARRGSAYRHLRDWGR